MATRKKTPDFEDSLSELEALVEALEEGNLSLDESLKSFERGIKITRECQQALKMAEQRVSVLTHNLDGDLLETPLVDDQPE